MSSYYGFSLKNVKHFPSSEWGPKGGTSCSILLNGKVIADYVNYGDGGEGSIKLKDNVRALGINDHAFYKTLAKMLPEEKIKMKDKKYSLKMDDDLLVDTILDLDYEEKYFKKYAKSHPNNACLITWDDYSGGFNNPQHLLLSFNPKTFKTLEDPKSALINAAVARDKQERLACPTLVLTHIFAGPEDFDVHVMDALSLNDFKENADEMEL